jgi:hypothetical protein
LIAIWTLAWNVFGGDFDNQLVVHGHLRWTIFHPCHAPKDKLICPEDRDIDIFQTSLGIVEDFQSALDESLGGISLIHYSSAVLSGVSLIGQLTSALNLRGLALFVPLLQIICNVAFLVGIPIFFRLIFQEEVRSLKNVTYSTVHCLFMQDLMLKAS